MCGGGERERGREGGREREVGTHNAESADEGRGGLLGMVDERGYEARGQADGGDETHELEGATDLEGDAERTG